MFKKLRERIAEEANKLPPVSQISFGNNSQRQPDAISRTSENFEDDVMPSDSSSIIEPHTVSQQFSIAEDEDASMSEPSTPQKVRTESTSSEKFTEASKQTANSVGNNQAPKQPSYVPQTDIESGVEEPPTLNLDGISKEQLLTSIQLLKARIHKYRNKYGELVKAYKFTNEEKNKFESALTDNQDKSLRRIAELREQCLLEQKAKAHLEENLRLILEEKDSRISVLETQINLLKEGQSENTTSNTSGEDDKNKSQSSANNNSSLQQDLKEKIQTEHEEVVEGLKKRLRELQKQQEDSIMSMAETKKNMHEELELKERQLNKTKDELRQITSALEQERAAHKTLEKQKEEKQKDLQARLDSLEKAMEEEKENLLRDFSRGKAEALTLIQEENAKQSSAMEEEWRAKMQTLQTECEKKIDEKDEELKKKDKELLSIQQQLGDNSDMPKLLEEERVKVSKALEELKMKDEELKKKNKELLSIQQQLGDNSDISKLLEEERVKVSKALEELKMKDEELKKRDKELLSVQQQLEDSSDMFKLLEEERVEVSKALEELKIKQSLVPEPVPVEEDLVVFKDVFKTGNKNPSDEMDTRSFQQLQKSQDLSEEIERLQENVKKLELENEDLKKKDKALREKMGKQFKNLKEKYENQFKEIETRTTKIQVQKAKLQEGCEKQIEDFKLRVAELQTQNEEIKGKYESEHKSSEQRIKELQAENGKLKKTCEKQVSTLETRLTQHLKKTDGLISKYDGKIKELESDVSLKIEENSDIKLSHGNEIKDLQSEILKLQENNLNTISQCEEQLKEFNSSVSKMEKQNNELTEKYENQIKELESQIEVCSSQNFELEEKILFQTNENSALRSKYDEVVKAQESGAPDLEKQRLFLQNKYEDEIKTLKSNIVKLEEVNSKLKKGNKAQTKELKSQISNLDAENAILRNEHSEWKQSFEVKIAEYEAKIKAQVSLDERNFELQSKIAELSYEISISNDRINKLCKDAEIAKLSFGDQIEASKHQVTGLENANNLLESQVKVLLTKISELEGSKTDLKKQIDESKVTESSMLDLQNELSSLKEENDQKLKTLENKATQLAKEYADLKEECDKKIHNLETKNKNNISKYDNLLKSSESQAEELLKQVSHAEEKASKEIIFIKDEFKIKLEKQTSQGAKILKEKIQTIEKIQKDLDACTMELAKHKSKAEEESKSSKVLLTQLRNELSVSLSKVEEFNEKTQYLEKEREQLMIKAQERVAATEAKHREDIEQLHQKIHGLQLQNKEIAKLKNENSILNGQLDESLMVAAANQVEASDEIASLNKKYEQLQDELSSNKKLLSDRETEMKSIISTLQKEVDGIELLKSEKSELCSKLTVLEEKCSIQIELDLTNHRLQEELDSLKSVKSEKDELNSVIQSLKLNEKKLCENLDVLQNEVKVLRTQCNCKACECDEMKKLKSENLTMTKKLKNFQSDNISCSTCDQLKEEASHIRSGCEEMLKTKEEELNQKMKLIMKEYSNQINIKDDDCDKSLSEVIEKSRDIEEKLERDHRLEIAALRQDIFERDCALEEMREHYEGIIKDKDSRLCLNEEKNSPAKALSTDSEFMVCNESSDWDDTWVVPEENCDNISPGHDSKNTPVSCDEHMQRIESMQKELTKCNSELKDLRILLRLSPPPSLHSNNNNFNSLSSTHVPEPTEYEYLRNILFEYMMGKETVTLVKVIAAVLRFNEEQTQLIVEREKAKQPSAKWVASRRASQV